MLSTHWVAMLSLGGVAVDALGGLYLAYDLFGAQRGLLRLVTKSASYGFVFGIGFALFLNLWFGLAGGFVLGPLMALEFSLHAEADYKPESLHEMALFALLRGLALGGAGWLTLDHRFGIAFAVLNAICLTIAYRIAGAMGGLRPKWLRPEINRIVLLIGLSRGLGFGLSAAAAAMFLREPHAITFAIRIGVVTGTFSGAITSLAPSIEWWVDHLPPRHLGAYGAALMLLGAILQAVQYLVPLFG
jgi:hypothetical protein